MTERRLVRRVREVPVDVVAEGERLQRVYEEQRRAHEAGLLEFKAKQFATPTRPVATQDYFFWGVHS